MDITKKISNLFKTLLPLKNKNKIITSEYLHPEFLKHIDTDVIKTIFELGSRDALDAIQLQKNFKATVYAFECNPDSIKLCEKNLTGQNNIKLIKKAVWNKNEKIKFFPVVSAEVDGKKINNIGASSCFKSRDDYLQKLTQKEITVDAIRIDDFCRKVNIKSVDLFCIDLQGAAMQALQGVGDKLLSTTKYIIAELENKPIYHDQTLAQEVENYLKKKNFELVEKVYRDDWFGDFLFKKKN